MTAVSPLLAPATLEVRNLSAAFATRDGLLPAVRDLSLRLQPGRILGLVGESGSGKSVTAHSILQLLPETGTESSGSIRYRGQQLLGDIHSQSFCLLAWR